MSTVPADNAPLPAGMSANAFSSLFQAVNGLRNPRALVALIGCTVSGVLVAGLLLLMAGTLGMLAGVLAFLVYVVAVGTGVNAAGLLQMDHARGISPRSTVDALVHGLMCIPKLIVLGFALFLVELAVFLVIALVLVACKIPFLGPLLFTLVFPVSIVVAGITIFGVFLCMVLSLPAIWQGATIVRALSQTLAIARSRLVEAVLLLVFVGFLSFAVGLIIFGVLGAGLLPTIAMSGSIVGFGGMGGLGSVMGMARGFGGGGHAIAGAIGGLVLWAVAFSLVLQVYLLGLCLVYLRVTEGLDLSATEAALRQKLDEARKRAAELGDKARTAAHRDGAPSAPAAPASPGSEAAASGGFAAAAAAAATAAAPLAPPRPPPAVPPAYPPPAPYPPDLPGDATDISLPFDDMSAPAPPHTSPSTMPAYSAPPPTYSAPPAYVAPAYVPPPAQPPAAAPVVPATTTCPQCLSPITAEDVFCGVCGYRLK